MKLLTPEEIEEAISGRRGVKALRTGATVKTACERLAAVERCQCLLRSGPGDCVVCGATIWTADDCPDCDGTGRAHRTWQDACRSLGAE